MFPAAPLEFATIANVCNWGTGRAEVAIRRRFSSGAASPKHLVLRQQLLEFEPTHFLPSAIREACRKAYLRPTETLKNAIASLDSADPDKVLDRTFCATLLTTYDFCERMKKDKEDRLGYRSMAETLHAMASWSEGKLSPKIQDANRVRARLRTDDGINELQRYFLYGFFLAMGKEAASPAISRKLEPALRCLNTYLSGTENPDRQTFDALRRRIRLARAEMDGRDRALSYFQTVYATLRF